MSATKAVLAAAAICFASSVNAHMIMAQPVPFGKSTLNNSPLVEDGSDFPCKQRTGVYDAEGANNVMAQGSKQTLSFIGSATHGGGSCQVSLTTDLNPTADSTFKVIHSIEGGCPIRNTPGNIGNSATTPDPDTYSFTIPSDLATGQYTLAWTWFNKVGNREMYMNCAPITVAGAGSNSSSSNTTAKRDEEYDSIDDSIFRRSVGSLSSLSSAPEMFVANIPTTVCETVDSMDLKFPNPGDSLEFDNSPEGTTVVLPTGTACPGMSGGSASAVGSAAPAATSAPAAGDASSAVTPASAGGVSPAAGTSANGASGAAASAPIVAPTSAAAAPSEATSSPAGAVPSEAASSPAAAAPSEAASSPAAAAPSSASSGTASTAGGLTGACATEGEFNCIGGSSFQQCASGLWSVVQPMADGTICTSGQSATLNMSAAAVKQKRAIRFSRGHVRRGISARW
ncbi:hypothetical protein MMC08_001999 [Hypocenomyce scalaris]|nr:hypothetical protein [Hypocenomyce scalaris]